MKNFISFMLIVIMFGFTSCSEKSKDEFLSRTISNEPEKQQFTPHPPNFRTFLLQLIQIQLERYSLL
jgi:hypothetical protein